MDSRIILLNGAPSSGKDAIASFLSDMFDYKHRYIAKPLVDLAISISGVSKHDWEIRYNDRKKNSKELPWSKLGGLSQREFLKMIAEDWIKPLLGKDYFAKKEILCSIKEPLTNVVISDCGFKEELDSYIQYYGENNILLVRIHREGKGFNNDSRNYLDFKHTIDIQNNTMSWGDERLDHLRNISSKIHKESMKISR